MPQSAPPKSLWLASFAVVLAAGVAWCVWLRLPADNLEPPTISFDGNSSSLEQTDIVPTLDTPVPPYHSVIWCGAFQQAWSELKSSVGPGPLQLEAAGEAAERLNSAVWSAQDFPDGFGFATAGEMDDVFRDSIRQQLAVRFPRADLPDLPVAAEHAAVAFGYLNAALAFTHHFTNLPGGVEFVSAAGVKTPVRAFGISAEQRHTGQATFRKQVRVLYLEKATADARPEFVLDLDRNSRPVQMVVARVAWQGTLDRTLADVGGKVAQYIPQEDKASGAPREGLGEADELVVPVMHWRIQHHFRELEGPDRRFLNPPLAGKHLAAAMESLELRMDRGALHAPFRGSVKVDRAKTVGRKFVCDQPYLLYLKGRYAEHPFFVMWVNNPELLIKRT